MAQEQGELHVHSGWMFKRLDDGVVRMRHASQGGEYLGENEDTITFDASSWCSIVSHVSAAGENYETFNAALTAHMAAG